MIEDRRLFAFNYPIGRIWYFIHLCIFAISASGIYQGTNFIMPFVNPALRTPFKIIMYFLLFIIFVSYSALIHRRFYNITGSKDSEAYKNFSGVTNCLTIMLAAGIVNQFVNRQNQDFFDIIMLAAAAGFAVITFVLIFIPGKPRLDKEH